jgi:STE24 endopeptidase
MENPVNIDLERQEKAKEYARISRRLMVVDLGMGAVYVALWLAFGWSAALERALLQLTSNAWLLVLLYAAVFGGVYLLIDLPLSYYEDYVLPHRYDQSTQTIGGWWSDQVRGLALNGVLGGALLEVIYAVLRAFPTTWWLWAAGIILVFSVLLANLAPVLLYPIFYKFVPLGDEYTELSKRLTNLAARTHTQVKGIYKFDMSRRTKSANAALTGLGNSRRIILGDTLLTEFTADEIETVMAHELGHHVHQDIPVGIAVQSLLTLAGLYLASLSLSWATRRLGFSSPADVAALPVFALVVGAYGLVTMPLTNAYSRWREKRADQYALQVTGNGQAFASALTRLANQNLSEADPEPWVEWLLYSHPALNKRIAMAQAVPPEN